MVRILLIIISLAILSGAYKSIKWNETELGYICIISNKGGKIR